MPYQRDILGGLKASPLQVLQSPTPTSPYKLEIKDVSYVGSYNWVESSAGPTIMVPGSPRIWLQNKMPFTVPLDGNITIIDQDGTHVPSTPLLPLFIAADIVDPLREKPFDWPSVDVVANRNSLRKLLGWANGTERWDFRIDVELAGERTILLNRWVESVIVDVNPRSYGHNFEEESTVPVPGCEQSIRHLRIIKYKLGDLTMVVRSEVDACIQDTLNDESNPSSDTMEVSGLSPAGTQMESYGLNVLIGGNFVSQHNLLELKTCVYKKLRFHDWEKVYPQLFLSNTPNVFLAIHDSGHFSELMTEKLGSGSLLRAAEKLNPQVQRLMATLEMIQKFAILHGKESRLSLVHQNGRLTVYLRENKESCLPAEIMSRFETP